MDVQSYRKAVAEVIRDGATLGVIERYYRVGSGSRKVVQDATQLSVCYYLVDKLVETPYWTHEPRLFIALKPLEPELSVVIQHLIWMQRVDEHVRKGAVILQALQRRVKAEETVPLYGELL